MKNFTQITASVDLSVFKYIVDDIKKFKETLNKQEVLSLLIKREVLSHLSKDEIALLVESIK